MESMLTAIVISLTFAVPAIIVIVMALKDKKNFLRRQYELQIRILVKDV